MVEDARRDEIARLFADTSAITKAIRREVREAVLSRKLVGDPLAVSQAGKVVLVAAEGIEVPYDDNDAPVVPARLQ